MDCESTVTSTNEAKGKYKKQTTLQEPIYFLFISY